MTLQDYSQDQVKRRGNTPKVIDLTLNFWRVVNSLAALHLDIHGDSYMSTESL